jgi:hypothetical protein
MRNAVIWMILLVVTTLSLAAPAPTIRVRWDREADFSKYETFSWEEGTAAVDPTIDATIVQSVGNELAIQGIFPDEAQPDLHVIYHASGRDEFELSGGTGATGRRPTPSPSTATGPGLS